MSLPSSYPSSETGEGVVVVVVINRTKTQVNGPWSCAPFILNARILIFQQNISTSANWNFKNCGKTTGLTNAVIIL